MPNEFRRYSKSDGDDLRQVILEEINSTKSTIRGFMGWLNEYEVVAALKAAVSRGVKVEIILRDDDRNRKSVKDQGIGGMIIWDLVEHQKSIVYDSRRYTDGSANWTASALHKGKDTNGENLTVSDSAQALEQIEETFFKTRNSIRKSQKEKEVPKKENTDQTRDRSQKQDVRPQEKSPVSAVAPLEKVREIKVTPKKSGVTINQILCSHTRLMGCSFEWRGAPCEPEKIFADDHLMAAVTTMASIKGLHLANWNLGVSVKNDPAALLRTRSEIPLFKNDSTNDTMRALFFIHSAERIFGISGGKTVECFPVYEYFNLDLRQRALMASTYAEPVAQIVQRKQA